MFKKSMLPPLNSLNEESEQDDSTSSSSENKSNSRPRKLHKYTPYPWQDYFEESIDVTIPDTSDSFRIYKNSPKRENGPLFVMHHGAGSSALTFGWTAKYIKELTKSECGVIAVDSRGHGATKTTVFDSDFSLETLSNDLIHVIKETVKPNQDIILVGHSMGGSVVVNVAHKRVLKNIIGVTVLDVVEGSAMDALSSMTKILSSRPIRFTSTEQAVKWSLQSDTLHNPESARLSIPALIESAGGEAGDSLKWITDLTKTQPFWTEWFQGLSERFLNSGTAKLLILAGTDRLDKPLIIGQMQGKFQLNIFPDAGHFLQEDTPMKTAACLIEFWRRNQRLVLPPKVKV